VKEFAEIALSTAKKEGVDYADIRICTYQNQRISARDKILTRLSDSTSSGFGVRTFYKGAWGFAASSFINKDEIVKVSKKSAAIAKASHLTLKEPLKLTEASPYVDHWQTPYLKDPFKIPNEKKIEFLLKINQELLKVKGIRRAVSSMNFTQEDKYFASTIGSFIEQLIMRADAEYTAIAVGKEGFESRSYRDMPLNKGYEYIEEIPFLENAKVVAEEAVEKLRAAPSPTGVKDLILAPSNLWLTIHESVGHATELDRVLGWEADYAGTSFATTDKLGKFQYGSKLVNFLACRTHPNFRSSVGYDDEGVKTHEWHLVKDGILVGYATDRSVAGFIDDKKSHACAYADNWSSMPIIRMPNVSLAPGGKKAPAPEELIADTKDAIYIEGTGSYSIDHQRRNFQFGGDAFWEVKNGKKIRMLKNVTYQSNTPEFWNSVDAICGIEDWKPYGTPHCGKGQPGQRAQMTHACSTVRARNINVGGAKI